VAGQNHHFGQYAPEKIPYAIDRYVKETNRLYGVLNKRMDFDSAIRRFESSRPSQQIAFISSYLAAPFIFSASAF